DVRAGRAGLRMCLSLSGSLQKANDLIPESLMAAMLCPRCGRENRSEALFCDQCGTRFAAEAVSRLGSPQSYTPKHLAERILTSRSVLAGERKQVTILFADLKGSMELLEDRDPQEARMSLDPVLEHVVEAGHRFEGIVSRVVGDG